MEDNVVASYLGSKFSSTLKEVEADLSSYSQIIWRFKSIERLINTMSDQDPGSLVDHLYDLTDALSECTIFAQEAASTKAFKKFFRARFESNMRSKLDKIEKNLREKNAGPDPPSPRTSDQPTHPKPSLIMGFESEVREMEELLMPTGSRFIPIGIVGNCGSGKTVLARKVFDSRRIEKRYSPRIWVSLTEMKFDINKRSYPREIILKRVLEEIGYDTSDLKKDRGNCMVDHLEKLHLRLKGKRYLIVLDDAWQLDEWFADLGKSAQESSWSFARGLPKGSGGAVIVTSREENVIRRMVGENHVIRPHLSDETCWNIFSDAVLQKKKIGLDHPKLIQMKDSVVNNFQGLPLAAKTLANVISDLLAEDNVYSLLE